MKAALAEFMLSGNSPRGEEPLRLSIERLPSRREVLRAAALCAASLAGLSFSGGCAPPAPDYEPSEWYLDLDDGTRVYVEDLLPPSGAPQATVIFAHGFNSTHVDWATFIPNADVRILAFDAPGHGNSDTYRTGIHSPERNAGIVEKLIALADPALPVMLAGYSMGGMTMAAFAAQHPEFDGDIVMINSEATPLNTPLISLGLQVFDKAGLEPALQQAMEEYIVAIQNLNLLADLPRSNAQWLIVGSRRDAVIPFDSVKLLASTLGDRAAFLELSGDHMPMLWDMQRLHQALSGRITALCSRQ